MSDTAELGVAHHPSVVPCPGFGPATLPRYASVRSASTTKMLWRSLGERRLPGLRLEHRSFIAGQTARVNCISSGT